MIKFKKNNSINPKKDRLDPNLIKSNDKLL